MLPLGNRNRNRQSASESSSQHFGKDIEIRNGLRTEGNRHRGGGACFRACLLVVTGSANDTQQIQNKFAFCFNNFDDDLPFAFDYFVLCWAI